MRDQLVEQGLTGFIVQVEGVVSINGMLKESAPGTPRAQPSNVGEHSKIDRGFLCQQVFCLS
jgi:hypothetical protein